MNNDIQRPGLWWPLLLGGVGFASGFFGPMLFVPEANQGPLSGIFITGPAGAVLGLVLLGVCTVIDVPARLQWRFLIGTAVLGGLTALLLIQPQPALRGYVMDLEVESCDTPIDTAPQILEYWSKRISEVTWATARPGWQQDMQQRLREAPGVVLKVQGRQQISVWEKRKPWNRGELFATAGRNAPDENSFYDSNGVCKEYPIGRVFRAFEKYALNGVIRPPSEWPPQELEEFVNVSPILPVPARFEHLVPDAAKAPR